MNCDREGRKVRYTKRLKDFRVAVGVTVAKKAEVEFSANGLWLQEPGRHRHARAFSTVFTRKLISTAWLVNAAEEREGRAAEVGRSDAAGVHDDNNKRCSPFLLALTPSTVRPLLLSFSSSFLLLLSLSARAVGGAFDLSLRLCI